MTWQKRDAYRQLRKYPGILLLHEYSELYMGRKSSILPRKQPIGWVLPE